MDEQNKVLLTYDDILKYDSKHLADLLRTMARQDGCPVSHGYILNAAAERLGGPVDKAMDRRVGMGRQEQKALLGELLQELKDKPTPRVRTLELPGNFGDHNWTDEFIRNSYTAHRRPITRDVDYVIIDLSQFLTRDLNLDVVCSGIGHVLQKLVKNDEWPMDVAKPEHIFWLIANELTLDEHLHLLSGENLKLVLAQPQHIPKGAKNVDREKLVDLSKQMEEIDRKYPGWIIQSGPLPENL